MTKIKLPKVSTIGAALIFDRDQVTIRRWCDEDMPHKMIDGKIVIDLSLAVPWWAENKCKGTLSDEQRLKRAQADKAELEVAEKLGDLLPTDQVVEEIGRMITAARQRLLALPSSAATHLVNLEKATDAQRILDEFIREALTELSEYRPKQFRPGGRRYTGEPETGDANGV